ncbi:MAG: SlyX family protein [Mariprofundaceae bacterium]|nr:SlyX family protein [Mariprofundaceae bacterium]
MMANDDTRLQEIESKIAFQERLLESLNEALTSQQRQLDNLHRMLARLEQQLASGDYIKHADEEVPPPHY